MYADPRRYWTLRGGDDYFREQEGQPARSRRAEWIAERLASYRAQSILEVGCGYGKLLHELRNRLDIHPAHGADDENVPLRGPVRHDADIEFLLNRDRLLDQELLHNQALIAVNLGTEFKTVRTTLESVNGINTTKLQVETDALAQTKKDLNDEHDKNEVNHQRLIAKVDALQSDTNKQAQEIVHRDAPLMPIAYNDQVAVYRSGLEGFHLHPTGQYRFRDARWK